MKYKVAIVYKIKISKIQIKKYTNGTKDTIV